MMLDSPSQPDRRANVSCREIVSTDRAAVVALLTRGFAAWRNTAFWQQAFDRLASRTPRAGLPGIGYALVADETIVGVLLLIASDDPVGGHRCNVSSWYVDPAYRLYASLLVRRALRHPDVTYLNVTPAPETWDLLAAQGYRRYSAGRFFGSLILGRHGGGIVSRVDDGLRPGPDLTAYEVDLLHDHARWGCVSLVCAGPEGRAPFVFGHRRRRGIPFAYLLHSRGLDSVSAHARPLGRHLLRHHGAAFIVADAGARPAGIPGRFQPDFPKFYRGASAPDPSDLAYTERAVFGV